MDENSDDEEYSFLYNLLEVFVVIFLIVIVPFYFSGVWPPYVAVVSTSMTPNLHQGDLVFVVNENKLPLDDELNHIATYQTSTVKTFNKKGNVIVYKPNGQDSTMPVIHRARFYVNESENWYEKANKSFINADSCKELPNCPADNSGFITKGDANQYYDQVVGISKPVKKDWVIGVARIRIPYLGWIRIIVSSILL